MICLHLYNEELLLTLCHLAESQAESQIVEHHLTDM